MAKLTIVNQLSPRNIATFKRADGSVVKRTITNAEYVALGRRNAQPLELPEPGCVFVQASGGEVHLSTASGNVEPLVCADCPDHAILLVVDANGRSHVLPKTLYSYSLGPTGGWTLDPQPPQFTVIDGELTWNS